MSRNRDARVWAVICEDPDGDGQADKGTVFLDEFNARGSRRRRRRCTSTSGSRA